MLSKCSNPKCNALFRYLHSGKLFRMEVPATFAVAKEAPEHAKKPPSRTEFFWLCERCSTQMTVIYDQRVGITTRLLPAFRAGAGV